MGRSAHLRLLGAGRRWPRGRAGSSRSFAHACSGIGSGRFASALQPENLKAVSEQTQATYIQQAAQNSFACDPTVTNVDWFLPVDEQTRNGRGQDGSTVISGRWQSGHMTAGGEGVSTPPPRHLAQLGLPPPRVGWLDVEPSNVWSRRRGLNTSVLRGMIGYLTRSTSASTVGIYSMWAWWHRITTGWRTSAPEWIPGSSSSCPAPFSAGPVWLTQAGSASLDIDIAC